MSDPAALVAACRALYAAIDAVDHRACERAGVSRNDLRCLNFLESGPRKPGEIALALGLTSGSVTALIDRLEASRLVVRAPVAGDRRSVVVAALPRMYDVLGPLYGSVAQALTKTASNYSQAELAAAIRHIDDATAAYQTALTHVSSP